ncbi:unnamed protein product [Acanthoscelides obtectus]|uniref:Uncharacterized protein n=1 Tax=Acanthoscelides obtectus TaxID=200917 RepID=A0A9P0KC92_ACAOB|nr:unnamed protein product [Acanthoscelides obtectus]CAK1633501.1 Zinc finger protein 583 [Acanthoscelides obtectus]
MLDSKKISSKDFQNSCRFCLEQKNPLTDIPAKSLEILEHILEVKFTDDEHLPTKACEDCAKEMESCSQFIEKCKNSYSALLAAVEEGHDKLNYQSSIDDTEEHNYDCEEKGNEAKAQAAHSSTEKYRNIIVDEDLYRSDYQKKNDKIIVERAMHYSIDEVAEIEFIQCKEVFSTDKQWLSTLAKHKVPHSNKPIIREQTKSSQENKKSIKNFYKKIKDENGKLKFQCTLCNRVLNTHSAALSHMNIHTGEKPFTCEFCGKKFTSISSVNIHKRQHTGETPYKCRVCNRGFRSSSNRKKHEDVHHFIMKDVDTDTESHDIGNNADSDIDKVECDICKKKINKHGFGVHRKSHLNEKKQFICTYCNKEFQKNSHLERHLRIHTGGHSRDSVCQKRPSSVFLSFIVTIIAKMSAIVSC